MKTKRNNSATVTIPTTTLNALKGLLFSKTTGVDLNGVIEDLGGDDLTAINVALAYNGMTPEIDKTDRYEYDWHDQYYKYVFTGYSLILDTVRADRYNYSHDGTLLNTDPMPVGMNYADWMNKDTDPTDIINKCVEYNNK